MKWIVELGQFEINYKGQSAIKAQALENFIVELSNSPVPEAVIGQEGT